MRASVPASRIYTFKSDDSRAEDGGIKIDAFSNFDAREMREEEIAKRAEVMDDLILSRRRLEALRSSSKGLYFYAKTTLGTLGLQEFGDAETEVKALMYVTTLDYDYRVNARVYTDVISECDRCLKRYTWSSTGEFELVLCTRDTRFKFLEDAFEAVELFTGPSASVDLQSHIHDAVCLSIPSKLLCSKDCQGIKPVAKGSYFGQKQDMEASYDNDWVPVADKQGSDALQHQLKELRERLSKGSQE